jgi:transposase InsO family protein
MKKENLTWGVKKIQGELLKLNICLDTKTIWNILQFYRHRGKIKKSLSWKKFLQMQAKSIYAMDFIVVDTIFKQRLFVYFIIAHQTREIIRFAITENPTKEFVKQQLIEFEQGQHKFVYMIHDNAASFNLDFESYGIESIRMSFRAPNMNSIAERFVGSVRREALDYFMLLSKGQLIKIMTEYIGYYNTQRPHQGLEQEIPRGRPPQGVGAIQKVSVLSGLHHHYFRQAA